MQILIIAIINIFTYFALQAVLILAHFASVGHICWKWFHGLVIESTNKDPCVVIYTKGFFSRSGYLKTIYSI